MTVMTANSVPYVLPGRTPRPVAGRLRSAISRWRKGRATRLALSHLSERELADIGIARGDIDRLARLL